MIRNTLVTLNPERVVSLNRNQVVSFSGISTFSPLVIINARINNEILDPNLPKVNFNKESRVYRYRLYNLRDTVDINMSYYSRIKGPKDSSNKESRKLNFDYAYYRHIGFANFSSQQIAYLAIRKYYPTADSYIVDTLQKIISAIYKHDTLQSPNRITEAIINYNDFKETVRKSNKFGSIGSNIIMHTFKALELPEKKITSMNIWYFKKYLRDPFGDYIYTVDDEIQIALMTEYIKELVLSRPQTSDNDKAVFAINLFDRYLGAQSIGSQQLQMLSLLALILAYGVVFFIVMVRYFGLQLFLGSILAAAVFCLVLFLIGKIFDTIFDQFGQPHLNLINLIFNVLGLFLIFSIWKIGKVKKRTGRMVITLQILTIISGFFLLLTLIILIAKFNRENDAYVTIVVIAGCIIYFIMYPWLLLSTYYRLLVLPKAS